jgi:hypothetical protein
MNDQESIRVSECCAAAAHCKENKKWRYGELEVVGTYYVCSSCNMCCEVKSMQPDPTTEDIIESIEATTFESLPEINHIDYIDTEKHPGYLRKADTIAATKKGYKLIRRWCPGQWNPDIYPLGPEVKPD